MLKWNEIRDNTDSICVKIWDTSWIYTQTWIFFFFLKEGWITMGTRLQLLVVSQSSNGRNSIIKSN